MGKFSPGVRMNIDYYVYRLIDPRNGKTFYVGKGKGDRMFAHAEEELKLEKGETRKTVKLDVIREIREANLEVSYKVHRHGMCEKCALEVEAALIDAYCTGQTKGHGADRGKQSIGELETKYLLDELDPDPKHRLLLIKTKWETVHKPEHGSVEDAVRRSWLVNLKRARRVDYVLAVIDNVCMGVYAPKGAWHLSEGEDRKQRGEQKRSEFPMGFEVRDDKILKRYYCKEIGEELWSRKAQGSLRYIGPL